MPNLLVPRLEAARITTAKPMLERETFGQVVDIPINCYDNIKEQVLRLNVLCVTVWFLIVPYMHRNFKT